MIKSSQGFYALVAVTALSVSANAGNLDWGLTAGVNSFAYTNHVCETSILQDRIYVFPKKKDFRERYKRLSQSKWFRNIYSGKSLGEIMTIEE